MSVKNSNRAGKAMEYKAVCGIVNISCWTKRASVDPTNKLAGTCIKPHRPCSSLNHLSNVPESRKYRQYGNADKAGTSSLIQHYFRTCLPALLVPKANHPRMPLSRKGPSAPLRGLILNSVSMINLSPLQTSYFLLHSRIVQLESLLLLRVNSYYSHTLFTD